MKRKLKMENKIGYVPIENFFTYKLPLCEAPRHMGKNIPAFAVLVIQGSMYPDGLVQMICRKCWEHFDKDMNSSNWNLLEL